MILLLLMIPILNLAGIDFYLSCSTKSIKCISAEASTQARVSLRQSSVLICLQKPFYFINIITTTTHSSRPRIMHFWILTSSISLSLMLRILTGCFSNHRTILFSSQPTFIFFWCRTNNFNFGKRLSLYYCLSLQGPLARVPSSCPDIMLFVCCISIVITKSKSIKELQMAENNSTKYAAYTPPICLTWNCNCKQHNSKEYWFFFLYLC